MKFKYKLELNAFNVTNLRRTQQYIDSEIIRRSDPLVPFDTGSLKRSGITGTQIGTGVIQHTAPYARKQYFEGRSGNQRGRKWVRRMWTAQGKDIIRNAQKLLNGG